MTDLANVRVTLVDDHPLVAYSIVTALAREGVACVPVNPAPLPDLVEAIKATQPTAVLLDLDLGPFGDSLPLIAPLTAADIRVLMLTASTDRVRLAETVEAEAIGVVQKSAAFPELIATIRAAVLEPRVLSGAGSTALLQELAAHRQQVASMRAPFDALTPREQETLAELADGATVSEIAGRWVVSETTVRSHVRAILMKLDVQSQLQAVVMAVRHGWIDPDRPAQ